MMDCQTHYWALRQQARYLFVPSVGNRGLWVVVALLWWWGVVFDLWIVVASILHAGALTFVVGVGVFCVCR